MGENLERSDLQPLQPIKLSKKGIVEVKVNSRINKTKESFFIHVTFN